MVMQRPAISHRAYELRAFILKDMRENYRRSKPASTTTWLLTWWVAWVPNTPTGDCVQTFVIRWYRIEPLAPPSSG